MKLSGGSDLGARQKEVLASGLAPTAVGAELEQYLDIGNPACNAEDRLFGRLKLCTLRDGADWVLRVGQK